jgi:hypothetical protein
MSLESQIDDLYRLPLTEFTSERNALAKTLSGDEAGRVKALAKPTLLPWTVNQLYWDARSTYDRLMKSGAALRASQIAALEGRGDALPRAAEAHRRALAEAVRDATRIAARHKAKPGADDLARMLEALSLSPQRPDPPGRLTELVQPAGFEALTGITPAAREAERKPASDKVRALKDNEEKERKKQEEERRRQLQARIKDAEREVERAREAETAAKEAFDEAREARKRAEALLDELRLT